MSLILKARENRARAVKAISARHANVFADDFGQMRRARPGRPA